MQHKTSEILDDGIHPNAKGYEVMYTVILDELKKSPILL